MKVLFVIIPSKGDGTFAPLWIRLSIGGMKAQLSTGKKAEISKWDSKRQRLKGNNPKANIINESLNQIYIDLEKIYLELKRKHETCHPEEVKKVYQNNGQIEYTLITALNTYIEWAEQMDGIKFRGTTVKKYFYVRKNIQLYLTSKGEKDVLLNRVNPALISDYELFLLTVKKQKQITVNSELKRLRKVLNMSIKNGWIDKNPFLLHEFPKVKTEKIFLTKEEIERVEEKDLEKNKTLELVRDIFIVSIYTGMHYGDLMEFDHEHIITNIHGQKTIEKLRQKNENPFTAPYFGKVESIVKKYSNDPRVLSRNGLLPKISNQKLNSYLKEIIIRCDIDKNISVKAGRKTFMNTICMENGITVDTATQCLGHKDTKVALQYYGSLSANSAIKEMEGLYRKYA